MNDIVADLVNSLAAKVEYESNGETVPLWLSVKIEDLCERLAYCD